MNLVKKEFQHFLAAVVSFESDPCKVYLSLISVTLGVFCLIVLKCKYNPKLVQRVY